MLSYCELEGTTEGLPQPAARVTQKADEWSVVSILTSLESVIVFTYIYFLTF